METELSLAEVLLQGGKKLTPKDALEHSDGKKEVRACLDPVMAIERQSAGGYHTMDVGVMFELLIPGVEHAEEANLSAEMLRVPCNLKECVGTGLQQEIVEDPFVLQGERRQFTGESKDGMNVACG